MPKRVGHTIVELL